MSYLPNLTLTKLHELAHDTSVSLDRHDLTLTAFVELNDGIAELDSFEREKLAQSVAFLTKVVDGFGSDLRFCGGDSSCDYIEKFDSTKIRHVASVVQSVNFLPYAMDYYAFGHRALALAKHFCDHVSHVVKAVLNDQMARLGLSEILFLLPDEADVKYRHEFVYLELWTELNHSRNAYVLRSDILDVATLIELLKLLHERSPKLVNDDYDVLVKELIDIIQTAIATDLF